MTVCVVGDWSISVIPHPSEFPQICERIAERSWDEREEMRADLLSVTSGWAVRIIEAASILDRGLQTLDGAARMRPAVASRGALD